MSFRFLHLADLHLETHYGGRPATRDRLRQATRDAFRRATRFAIDEGLDAVLVAGDLFDEPLLSLATELELARNVEKLTEAGIWFLYACGNHDPGASGRRAAALGIEGAERVHVFRRRQPEPVRITNAAGIDVGVVVGAGHEIDREDKNLAASFPKLDTNLPVVGLLHTQIESARAAEQHDRYAPSSPADFERLRYAYWALGHVHLRQQALEGQPVWYSGNLQGRNLKELGPKGGLLVEARGGGYAEPEFVPFAPVRWESLVVDELEGCDTANALMERLLEAIEAERSQGTEELAIRLELEGASPLTPRLRRAEEREMLEEELIARGVALDVTLDVRRLRVLRDLEAIRNAPTVLRSVLETLERADTDDTLLARLAPAALAGITGAAKETDSSDASTEGAFDFAEADARMEYLRELLQGLDEELLERVIDTEASS